MKCPRCGWIANRPVASCPGCDFSIAALDKVLGAPPAAAGALDDAAGVLSPAGRGRLALRIAELGARVGGDIVVVTRESTAPVRPAEYAFWLCNRWGLAAPHRRGLLALLALQEQRIELEVGYGWQAGAGDRETGELLDRDVVPRLAVHDFDGALLAAVESIAALLETAGAPDLPRAGG